jgi:hypothetical protein
MEVQKQNTYSMLQQTTKQPKQMSCTTISQAHSSKLHTTTSIFTQLAKGKMIH